MNNLATNQNINKPEEMADQYYSVEIELDGIDFPYQFKIWNIVSKPMCFLVKEDSHILPRLKVGDTLEMKYYSLDSAYPTEPRKTAIREITKNDQGQFKGHYLVALEVLEEVPKSSTQESLNGLSEKELFEKARELFDKGMYDEVIHVYTSIIDINPNHAPSYFNRGVAYRKLGNHGMALKDLKVSARLGIRKAQNFLKSNGIIYESRWAPSCG